MDITDLLHEQMKSLSELQNAVQRQVAKVNALKGIAAKGFEAYQQQSGGKVRTIFRVFGVTLFLNVVRHPRRFSLRSVDARSNFNS